MKQIFTFFICFGFIPIVFAQSLSSTNSGASSTNTLVYSVGDIYVISTNPNESSSGFIGAVTKIEFSSLGINDVEFSQKLKFYPNPTNDSVYLDTENEAIKTVFIFDLNGKIIDEKSNINNKIDLSNLQNGTYIIKTDNNNIQSFKIIKQ